MVWFIIWRLPNIYWCCSCEESGHCMAKLFKFSLKTHVTCPFCTENKHNLIASWLPICWCSALLSWQGLLSYCALCCSVRSQLSFWRKSYIPGVWTSQTWPICKIYICIYPSSIHHDILCQYFLTFKQNLVLNNSILIYRHLYWNWCSTAEYDQ